MMFFYDYYWLILIPVVVAMIASANVNSTYRKYQQVANSRGLTGEMAARKILDANGLFNVRIEHIAGKLSDHFDPRDNVVRLSDSTFASSSVAAVGVAAHEVGHTICKGICSYEAPQRSNSSYEYWLNIIISSCYSGINF